VSFDTKEILKQLCLADGVSGNETGASAVAAKYLSAYCDGVCCDDFGNVRAVVKPAKEGEPTVLLEAHIDEIGLVVTHIDEDGFLKVSNCGGVDRRLLLAQQVTVHGKEPIKGVILSTPPHLESEEDAKKVPEIEQIAIDIGMTKEAAEKAVSLGDKITFDSAFLELMGDRVSVKAVDDRAGVTAVLYALEQLKEENYPCGLSVLFSSQEELGERGATIGSYHIAPDLSLSVDVSFAHTPDAEPHKCGKMGAGVMIGIAPSLDREVSERLIEVAKAAELPYQFEIMSGETSTDADTIGVSGGGVKTGLLSIPIRYMHTPIETVAISDIEAVGKLLAAYLLQL